MYNDLPNKSKYIYSIMQDAKHNNNEMDPLSDEWKLLIKYIIK